MDNAQLKCFLHYLIGWRSIGVARDEEVSEPICPEMRAFLTGTLGDEMPAYPAQALTNKDKARALSRLLRQAAAALDAVHREAA